MTVATSIIDVNNGNAGWTKANVMDALETAFSQLGLNSGTEATNVPQACITPAGNSYEVGTLNSAWYHANGGDPGTDIGWNTQITHRYLVTEVGTDYRIEKKVGSPGFYAPYYSAMLDQTTDEIIEARHGLKTGDPVRYLPGETEAAYSLGTNLAPDTLVYVIKTSRDRFKVATSAANAANGTAIDLDGAASTGKTFPFIWQQEAQQASDYINPTIEIYKSDIIEFENAATNTTNITVCMNTDVFNTNQRVVYNDPTYNSYPESETSITYRINPTNISCVPGANLTWSTASRPQTETEPTIPASELHPSIENIPENNGITKYIYCSESTATAKGEIILLPGFVNHSNVYKDYYKYTVPASGGRSELKLRIWRYGGNGDGKLGGVTIHSIGSGWNAEEVITIPGEDVGFNATTGDIRFGVRTPETSSNAYDGTAEIVVTTVGGGSSMFQKHKDGHFGILKVENDPTKKYGYTYYCLTLLESASSHWRLYINSGSGWEWLNRMGTNSTDATGSTLGRFTGYEGLDWGESGYNPNTNSACVFNVSNNATPTSYPLQIRTYRAQAPQDTNFSIIQFCSVINEVVTVNSTISFCVGDGYGSNTFDLDDVFLGGVIEYAPADDDFKIRTWFPGYSYSGSWGTLYSVTQEPPTTYSVVRNAFYGYMRGNTSTTFCSDIYYQNIYSNDADVTSVYYRNNTYDKYSGIGIGSNADYFKPIKTIPISQKMIPCPYYLPDDFAILQVTTTPGLISFRTGDTVTISASEVYTIVVPSYTSQQTGLDGISNNTTKGTLLLARTT